MAAQTSDEESLIQSAIRSRRQQQSGWAMILPLAVVVILGVVGWLLVFHAPLVINLILPAGLLARILDRVLLVLGALALVIGAWFVLSVAFQSPLASWGNPAPGNCPSCGRPGLREDKVAAPQFEEFREAGSPPAIIEGVVVLCGTPECDYALVRSD